MESKRKKYLPERSWAYFILMKPVMEGVGDVEHKQIQSLQVEQKEKERKKRKTKKNAPTRVNRVYHGRPK